MPHIRRGDIYYIRGDYPPTGSEQAANRPGIIVSNAACNKHSPVVSVVYLTTRTIKKRLPTHVDIKCTLPSIALCEQVHSVSKERLEGYKGHITEDEEREIDAALKVSLAINDEGMVQMNSLQISSNPTEEYTDRTPIEVLLQVGEDERVSARDAHKFLTDNVGDFSKWAKANITGNDFAESGADFTVVGVTQMVENNFTKGLVPREITDYRLSIPFAKKLCMISRTMRGEQARDYFVEVEKKLQHIALALPQLTTNEMILQLATSAVEVEREIKTLKESQAHLESKVDTAIKVFAKPGNSWKDSMEMAIRGISGDGKFDLIKFKGKLYTELEVTAACDLSNRQTRLRTRLKKQGATCKERSAVTKLDVISKDKQLRSIFEGIIRKYQALSATD